MDVGEGDIGICVWFGAPILHRMSGLNLAWHWHVVCVHVHLRSHFGIVCSGGLFLRWLGLVNVKNRVFLLACNVWIMRYIALLCRVILRPFKYGCLHVHRRCHHVTLSLRWHCVLLGF